MFRHIIVLSALALSLSLADTNTQTNSSSIENVSEQQPKNYPDFQHHQPQRHTWHHQQRRVHHGPDVFHRMRMDRMKHRINGHGQFPHQDHLDHHEEPQDHHHRHRLHHPEPHSHYHGQEPQNQHEEEQESQNKQGQQSAVVSEDDSNSDATEKADSQNNDTNGLKEDVSEIKSKHSIDFGPGEKLGSGSPSVENSPTPQKSLKEENDHFHLQPWERMVSGQGHKVHFDDSFGPHRHVHRFHGHQRDHHLPRPERGENMPFHFTSGATQTQTKAHKLDTSRPMIESIPSDLQNGLQIQLNHPNGNREAVFERGDFRSIVRTRGREDTTLTVTNRPPDIIIRNTFKNDPKSWIDLRITIDENGILNIEAGPQGVVTAANSTNSEGRAEDPNIPQGRAENQAEMWNSPRAPIAIQHGNDRWHHHHHFNRYIHPHFHQGHMPHWPPMMHQSHHFPDHQHQFGIAHEPQMQHGKLGQSQVKKTNEPAQEKPTGKQHAVHGPSHPPHVPERKEQSPKASPVNDQQQKPAKKEEKKSVTPPKTASVVSSANKIVVGAETDNTDIKVKEVINIDNSASSGCPALKCPVSCPGGLSKLDLDTGCPMCDCCPDVMCARACPNGFESDQFGCPICRCV